MSKSGWYRCNERKAQSLIVEGFNVKNKDGVWYYKATKNKKPTSPAAVSKFYLEGLETEVDWQIAYLASKHADQNERITLTYDTPSGDITLVVQKVKNIIQIKKHKVEDT